jgi:hypothetical protein
MANKKLLGTATSDLKLPTKKAKGEKKPKWQAKTGKRKPKEVEIAMVVCYLSTPLRRGGQWGNFTIDETTLRPAVEESR